MVVNVIYLISAVFYMLNFARVNAMTVSYINKGLAFSKPKQASVLLRDGSRHWHRSSCLDNAPNLTNCLQKSMMQRDE